MFIARAKAFENEVPTNNEPKSPGPRVNAIAFICFFVYLLALRQHRRQVLCFADVHVMQVQE